MASKFKKILSGAGQKSVAQNKPGIAVITLMAVYFLLDYVMMSNGDITPLWLSIIFVFLASSTLFSVYVNDYQRGIGPKNGTDIPRFVKNKQRYVMVGWLAIMAWGFVFAAIEPVLVPKFFKAVDETYYPSQIILMLFIAPVIEEIVFRYLLYDRWLRIRLGWFGGFLVASIVFVLFHPVTNAHALIIYWAPTVMFFLVYHEFGLYGSILIHMVYNMMAI